MSDADVELSGPDLCQGIVISALAESVPLLGHAQGEPTIVVRRGKELFAIGAVCTHYSGPLAEGLVEGDTVRCRIWPLILIRIGVLADRYTSDAPLSAIRRSTRSMLPLLIRMWP